MEKYLHNTSSQNLESKILKREETTSRWKGVLKIKAVEFLKNAKGIYRCLAWGQTTSRFLAAPALEMDIWNRI